MLAVSALRESAIKDEKQKGGEMEMDNNGGFPDFLDSIDFDDLFLGIDVLPDLLPDLSSSEGVEKASDDDHHSSSSNNNNKPSITNKEGDNSRSRKTTSNSAQGGKRKVKVDWTPELHRRFVQAVEQLGVDKAVPSRILEIMGIDCLTRHNIASHLQKYRSHRKHLLAREAEAATWSQRRAAAAMSSRTTMGFPHHHHHHHHHPMIHFMRPPHPLHVWGHPSIDQHLRLCPPPLPPASTYNSYSYSWQRMQQVPPNNSNNNNAFGIGLGLGLGFPVHTAAVSFVPSKESIDAAIGDVLAKPWLPLPLGLKPPSTDSVLCELHRHGVPNVPPSSA